MTAAVDRLMVQTPVYDVHTHLFDPAFGDMLLYNVDELLTYHYLIAELFRHTDMPFADFFKLEKRAQADLIYRKLFLEATPVSEAARGVVTTLKLLDLHPESRCLAAARELAEQLTRTEYVNLIFKAANVSDVATTNDPFDDKEAQMWLRGAHSDRRFHAALRIDPMLLSYAGAVPTLQAQGYAVGLGRTPEENLSECRRFLDDWAGRMDAQYLAVSLSDAVYAPGSFTERLVREAVVPVCTQRNIPFAMMIGVRRQINPELKLAGDGVGRADLSLLEGLCRDFPHTKFMATLLSMENQHELTVMARKFRNLLVFGCWWFLNDPGFIRQITRMRLELLATSFVPQHSDARVLDQLAYKWNHSRQEISKVLVEKYALLMDAGWALTQEEIERDVRGLLWQNLKDFLALRL